MVKETRLYELLKVEPCADDDTLKKKYRELARKYHPDRNPDGAELFKEISLAYATLKDPEKRNLYNVKGEAGLKKPCCKAPAYPDKTATSSKKASDNANNVQNAKVLEIGKFKIPTSNNIKRKIGSDGLDGHEIPIKRIFVGNAPFGHDYAAGINKSGQIHADHNHSGHSHAGHDHSGHSHAGHDHSGHSHAGHDHSGHSHAAHDHSGHMHAAHDHSGHSHVGHTHSGHSHIGHDHSGHSHAGHDHSGHSHVGHDHFGHGHTGQNHSGNVYIEDVEDSEEEEDDEEGEGEGCPCCPAIQMSPAMMQSMSHGGHDHSGHSHGGHDHSGHDHGHNHFEDEDESEDEEEGEGEGCPCCPAIQMSPAMMQKLMAMQMQMGMYGYGAPGGPAAQMFGYYGRPSGSYITDITEDPQ